MSTTTSGHTDEDIIVEVDPDRERKLAWINGLRDLADWFESRIDLCPTYGEVFSRVFYTDTALADAIRTVGKSEKYATDYALGVEVKIEPHTVHVYSPRNVTCEQVPTGEVVEKTTVADVKTTPPPGARNVRTVTQLVYEVDEDVMEWKCPPSLLNPGSPDEGGGV